MILTDNINCNISLICTYVLLLMLHVVSLEIFLVVIPGAAETRYSRHFSSASGNPV